MAFRRRQRAVQPAEVPEENPAESVESIIADNNTENAPMQRVSVRRRLRFPAIRVNWSQLILIVALVALTVFALLLNGGALPRQVIVWWPLVIAVLAGLWLLISLVRRDSAALLGSTALLGVSISLLLASAYQVPLGATLVGVALISIGMGIVVRGLLWQTRAT